MACAYSNQDRYLVIALPPASRTAVHLRAGTKAGNRIADPIALLTHHNRRSFPFLESAFTRPRPHITSQ